VLVIFSRIGIYVRLPGVDVSRFADSMQARRSRPLALSSVSLTACKTAAEAVRVCDGRACTDAAQALQRGRRPHRAGAAQAGGLLGYIDALSGGSISRVGVFSLGAPRPERPLGLTGGRILNR